jgi:methyltransferase (TIGR00027 family)
VEKEPLIKNVSDTSFWVAHYRAEETERTDALFRDPLAKRLVGDRGKRISDSMAKVSRYTAWSVITRTVIIDRFIEKYVAMGVDAVINLGAGLDTRPYRMSLPENLEWIEVDYPNIVDYKSEILRNEKPVCKLTRVAVDLANDAERKSFLQSAAFDAKRVLVLTEGVIPYLSTEQVEDLSRDLLAQARIAYWVTEYFHRRVYRYLQSAVRNRKMRNSPFLFYPDDWFGFFRSIGWSERETVYTGEIATTFKRRPPMPWFARLIFPLMPKSMKEKAGRMAGFTLLERAEKA